MLRGSLGGAAAFALLVGCGARSGLGESSGRDGEGGAGAEGAGGRGGGGEGAGSTGVDPDVACPLVCTTPPCEPAVLLDDTPTTWHTMEGGVLYYTTAHEDGRANGLYRRDVCGGGDVLLYEATLFGGYAAFADGAIVVPVLDPGHIVRVPIDGSAPTILREYPVDVPDKPRSIRWDGASFFATLYNFDGGMSLYRLSADGSDFVFLEGGLPDPETDEVMYGTILKPNYPVFDDAYAYMPTEIGIDAIDKQDGSSFAINYDPVNTTLVLEGDWFYFGNDQGLFRVSRSGGDPEQLSDWSERGTIAKTGEDFLRMEYGEVWRGDAAQSYGETLFTSPQEVLDFVLAGESVYVHTERRIVRVSATCAEGPCFVLD